MYHSLDMLGFCNLFKIENSFVNTSMVVMKSNLPIDNPHLCHAFHSMVLSNNYGEL